MTWAQFFSSQIFGIILVAFLTAGFTWFVEWRKSIIANTNKLREKREEVYLKACDILMRLDKCYREKYVEQDEYEEYKKLFNDLQSHMLVYASSEIYDEYYKLCEEIATLYAGIKKKKQREKLQRINANKVEQFANKIRKELGVKGDVLCQ